jgi:hypothetical protein
VYSLLASRATCEQHDIEHKVKCSPVWNGDSDGQPESRARLHDRPRLDRSCILANYSEQFLLSDDEA